MKELLLIFKFSNCQTATLSNHLVEKELIGINLSMIDKFILWLTGSSLSSPQARGLYPNMSQISNRTNTKNPQISREIAKKSPIPPKYHLNTVPLVVSEASAGVVFNLDRVTSWLGLILIVVFVSSFFGDDAWWLEDIIISYLYQGWGPHGYDPPQVRWRGNHFAERFTSNHHATVSKWTHSRFIYVLGLDWIIHCMFEDKSKFR